MHGWAMCDLHETPTKMATGSAQGLRRQHHNFEAKSLSKQARLVLMI
jgi:hypothetical protein